MGSTNQEELWEVEKIVGKEFDKKTGEPLYITKWVNYSSDDNTLEPVSSFKRCPHVIHKYECGEALTRGMTMDLALQVAKLPLDKYMKRSTNGQIKKKKAKHEKK